MPRGTQSGERPAKPGTSAFGQRAAARRRKIERGGLRRGAVSLSAQAREMKRRKHRTSATAKKAGL